MRPENRTHGYVDRDAGVAELKLHAEPFDLTMHNLPAELTATKAKIEARLAADLRASS